MLKGLHAAMQRVSEQQNSTMDEYDCRAWRVSWTESSVVQCVADWQGVEGESGVGAVGTARRRDEWRMGRATVASYEPVVVVGAGKGVAAAALD